MTLAIIGRRGVALCGAHVEGDNDMALLSIIAFAPLRRRTPYSDLVVRTRRSCNNDRRSVVSRQSRAAPAAVAAEVSADDASTTSGGGMGRCKLTLAS